MHDEDILPASLSKELITDLLKQDLNFNGLVVTDASHMLGMTASMKREDYVPLAIAAGCDMFLFFNDIEEDFNFMLQGYRKASLQKNDLTMRLNILGLKAKIHLHDKQAQNTLEKRRGCIRCHRL